MLKFNKLMLPAMATLAISTSALTSPLVTVNQQTTKFNPLAPGIIIKYKNTDRSESLQQSNQRAKDIGQQYGFKLKFKRMMSGNAEVISIEEGITKTINKVSLETMIAQLNNRADIEYAEIDALMVPYATPNDTAYNTQWHYFESAGGMRLPAAWDLTTGNNVTVAVLDTGYRPHSDLAGNVVGQYDMISSSSVANDGGGRDSNAQDPGDWTTAGQCGTGSPASNSSWHGTHVAGTVGAISNNNNGVAGVAWNVDLVPVRVLGTCGGSLSDIADGIRWAAGLSVSGAPSNPNPADVINMSLGSGSPGSCSSSYQSAITAAVNAGTTIVVAAGNSNSSSGYPPANCSGVVAVAATNRNGGRAYYSNYGSVVDVAAPGGDGCNPTGEGEPTSLSDCEGGVWSEANMIQSTHNTGTSTPGSDNIAGLQGTSMAAPHVAGLAALMYAAKPSTTPAEVESVLKSTSRAFPNVSSHQCTTSNCGSGIVDADAAVMAMTGTPPPPPTNNVLVNGVPETGLSGALNSQTNYTMAVPSGATNLSFNMSGGSGDADLYVKFGSAPTTSSYDCRPYVGGNSESCPIASAQTGTYHVMIVAYSAYTGVSVTGSYSTSVPNVAPNASFTSSCNDLTCNFNASGSSDSDGSIASYSWSFGGSGATASNTFASTGTYSVTLTVTDNDGATDTATSSVTVTAPPVNVAPNASFTSSCNDLSCSFNAGGSTDSDGSIASYSWSFGGSGVSASNTFASAGTYSVTLTVTDNDGATDTSTQSVSVTAPPPPVGNVLTNGVTKTGLAAAQNNTINFTMAVPAGATDLNFAMSGGSGDADLYVKFGSAPTTSSYDCRPYVGGNTENCPIANAQAGTYHVMVRAYSTFSGVNLTGSYSSGGGQGSLFESTSNVNIPDNNVTGATSNMNVTRTGNSGNIKITYNIVHTYRGDLKVEIVAPNGATAVLREPSGGGTNNINESTTINAGTTPANGTWGLKVTDNAGADTGYIDSWSIEFL